MGVVQAVSTGLSCTFCGGVDLKGVPLACFLAGQRSGMNYFVLKKNGKGRRPRGIHTAEEVEGGRDDA